MDAEATALEFIPESLKILGGKASQKVYISWLERAPLPKKILVGEKNSTIIYPSFEYLPNSPQFSVWLSNTILSTEQSPSHQGLLK